uniref:Protein UL87 n=1 Tax=Human betaherpesvirus 6A TaxID=32603 RepID=A0A219XZZ2_9BETA|nr:protein UL87 [Human betaherpesvirus 6A]
MQHTGNCETLIVNSCFGSTCARSIPVFIDSCDLTAEVSRDEETRLARSVPVVLEKIESIIEKIFQTSGPNIVRDKDRAKIALCRLLLGPVAVPCFCEEWDTNDYLSKSGCKCIGPILYIHTSRCRCSDIPVFKFSIMKDYYASHVFRGLLSLKEWNTHLPNVLCTCELSMSDRYVATVYPKQNSIYLEYYPYFLCYLCRHLTVIEIEQCTNDLISLLGPKVAQRVIIHFKLLFGFRYKPHIGTVDSWFWENFFMLELHKLWLTVVKHNRVTTDFFNVVYEKIQNYKQYAIKTLRMSSKAVPAIQRLCLAKFKQQLLYLNIKVTVKKNKREMCLNGFVYGKTLYVVESSQLIFRNLLLLYYDYSLPDECKTNEENVLTAHYIRVISRLSFKRSRSALPPGVRPDFIFVAQQPKCKELPNVPGGIDFAEITSVRHGAVTLNAFNTNKVMNLKATISKSANFVYHRIPKTMTHSFVMYKHTFKEPAFTVSTFVSNDDLDMSSLNINIRGPYCDFLYALGVYKMHVSIRDLFLPAFVCNSNNSVDLQGLENQDVVRNRKKKVYWITNFPCMISNANKVNVGWFKAGTGIIPRVSGEDLQNVLLQELNNVREIPGLVFDMDLHQLLVLLEQRNLHQIPFLVKQFLIFLRLGLLMGYGHSRRNKVHDIMLHLISNGLFDFNKNSVANTKIKHGCALVGTRLANNVPKIIARQKKMKLDHMGRNANSLAVLRFIVKSGEQKNKTVFIKLLEYLAETSTAINTRNEVARLLQTLTAKVKT